MNAATKLQALERELERAAQKEYARAFSYLTLAGCGEFSHTLGLTNDPLVIYPNLGVNNYCPACDEVLTSYDDVFAGACKSCRIDELRADYYNTCMEDAQ